MASSSQSPAEFRADAARVEIYPSVAALAKAAAEHAGALIQDAILTNGRARIIAATGNSQIEFIADLVQQPVDWQSVELFHMDEYVGMSPVHPASFRLWIKTRFEEKIHPAQAHYLNGDACNLHAEIERYAKLLQEAPIDVAFVGFGENGHIAFNDPPVANFNDPAVVKKIELDDACRRQQLGEGHFPNLESVPTEALSITCPGLFRAQAWVCCVPERRKAEAVHDALEGPILEKCPASLVRRHPNAVVFLDSASASLLRVSAS
jgi:glucosamine-6-phosphate deaminase